MHGDSPHSVTIKIRPLVFREGTTPDFADMAASGHERAMAGNSNHCQSIFSLIIGHDIKSRTHAHEILATISHLVGQGVGSTE